MIISIGLCQFCFGQNFADKEQYLVDSLELENVSPGDRELLDSCLNVYHTSKSDTLKVNAIQFIVEECWDDNVWPKYNQWVYDFSQARLNKNPRAKVKRALKIALAGALNNMGFIYDSQGEFVLALGYYRRSLKIHEEVGNKKGMATAYNNMGYIYDNQGNIPLALEYYHKCLLLEEEVGNKRGMATAYLNLGYVYQKQDDIEMALRYLKRGLDMNIEIGDLRGTASAYNNIGTIYESEGDIKEAEDYFLKSLVLRIELGNKKDIANSYHNLGRIYDHEGDIESSLEYYFKSLELREEAEDQRGIAHSLGSIGHIYYDQGDLKNARVYAERGLETALTIGFPFEIQYNAGLLRYISVKEGNYMEAYSMFELYIQYRDSVNNREIKKESIRQQTRYEFEKELLIQEQKETEEARKESKRISRRDRLQYSLILILILLVFGAIITLGFVKVSPSVASGLIFFAFLILFEFLLVLSDPLVDRVTGGAPAYKLAANALLAALLFVAHSFFEKVLKRKLVGKEKSDKPKSK